MTARSPSEGGVTRRDGDNRDLVVGYSWLEFFPGRIVSEGLNTE